MVRPVVVAARRGPYREGSPFTFAVTCYTYNRLHINVQQVHLERLSSTISIIIIMKLRIPGKVVFFF